MPSPVHRVRARNESAWLLPNDGQRTNHRLRLDMRQFADSDEVDLVIVGCGAGGSVLTQRLARAGWKVAALDAGPFWDPDTDWVSDEAGSHRLYWTDPRVIAGADPVPLGSNNSGRGVGGSMVHYAGYTPRFHPSDFMTATLDGVGADWPVSYSELRPYYEMIEQELPVAGERWPWGDPHGYPHRPHPVGGNGGRYLMVQGAPQTAGRFDAEVRLYKAPPPEVSTEEFYETDPARGAKRGFSVQTVSPLPITWAEHVGAQGHWGRALREYMSDYVHWACLGALCEFLPRPQNRVTLAAEKDSYGLPVARFSYSQCDNDRALARAAQSVMENILRAAGADEVITIQRYAHLVGGARMAADEQHGVVDRDCRSFAVPNLYITDGSVLPTQGSANPALTIMAVAARAADHLAAGDSR